MVLYININNNKNKNNSCNNVSHINMIMDVNVNKAAALHKLQGLDYVMFA